MTSFVLWLGLDLRWILSLLPVWCVAMCLMADCLNGSQPNDLRFEFGLLVRQFSLAFELFRALAWVSLMAWMV